MLTTELLKGTHKENYHGYMGIPQNLKIILVQSQFRTFNIDTSE